MVVNSLMEPVMAEKDSCPQCNGNSRIKDIETGEIVCRECGLVLNNQEIDVGPEWRAYDASEINKRERTVLGMKYSIFDKGFSTVLSGNKDAYGKILDKERRITYLRLNKFNNRSKITDSWRRNLSIAFSELDRICSILHMPNNIKERAAVIYRKVLKADLVRGRSIDAFISACLYAACRLENLPRSLRSISDASTCDIQSISRHYRLMIRELNMEMPIDTPMKYLSSFAAKLKVNSNVERHSANILRLAREKNVHVGKNPKGMAAAALYMACLLDDEKIVQREVAEVSEISAVTLRKRYKELESLINLDC
ncbi:transcription initiation factor IIB [Candidatus Bathyarchaeota archaeon]|nr:transcription initiation factor IIB [Candidatus Bathyarchaeota archaeon]